MRKSEEDARKMDADTKLDFMLKWPSRESKVATLPSAFKMKFPRLTSIIDCFEIIMEQKPKKCA